MAVTYDTVLPYDNLQWGSYATYEFTSASTQRHTDSNNNDSVRKSITVYSFTAQESTNFSFTSLVHDVGNTNLATNFGSPATNSAQQTSIFFIGITSYISQNLTGRTTAATSITSSAFTFVDNTGGLTMTSSIDTTSASGTVGGTSGTSTATFRTSTTSTISRTFRSTTTSSSTVSYFTTALDGATPTTTSSTSTRNTTNTTTASTSTLSGRLFTISITSTYNVDFQNRILAFIQPVSHYEDAIDKNEVGYVATKTSTVSDVSIPLLAQIGDMCVSISSTFTPIVIGSTTLQILNIPNSAQYLQLGGGINPFVLGAQWTIIESLYTQDTAVTRSLTFHTTTTASGTITSIPTYNNWPYPASSTLNSTTTVLFTVTRTTSSVFKYPAYVEQTRAVSVVMDTNTFLNAAQNFCVLSFGVITFLNRGNTNVQEALYVSPQYTSYVEPTTIITLLGNSDTISTTTISTTTIVSYLLNLTWSQPPPLGQVQTSFFFFHGFSRSNTSFTQNPTNSDESFSFSGSFSYNGELINWHTTKSSVLCPIIIANTTDFGTPDPGVTYFQPELLLGFKNPSAQDVTDPIYLSYTQKVGTSYKLTTTIPTTLEGPSGNYTTSTATTSSSLVAEIVASRVSTTLSKTTITGTVTGTTTYTTTSKSNIGNEPITSIFNPWLSLNNLLSVSVPVPYPRTLSTTFAQGFPGKTLNAINTITVSFSENSLSMTYKYPILWASGTDYSTAGEFSSLSLTASGSLFIKATNSVSYIRYSIPSFTISRGSISGTKTTYTWNPFVFDGYPPYTHVDGLNITPGIANPNFKHGFAIISIFNRIPTVGGGGDGSIRANGFLYTHYSSTSSTSGTTIIPYFGINSETSRDNSFLRAYQPIMLLSLGNALLFGANGRGIIQNNGDTFNLGVGLSATVTLKKYWY